MSTHWAEAITAFSLSDSRMVERWATREPWNTSTFWGVCEHPANRFVPGSGLEVDSLERRLSWSPFSVTLPSGKSVPLLTFLPPTCRGLGDLFSPSLLEVTESCGLKTGSGDTAGCPGVVLGPGNGARDCSWAVVVGLGGLPTPGLRAPTGLRDCGSYREEQEECWVGSGLEWIQDSNMAKHV